MLSNSAPSSGPGILPHTPRVSFDSASVAAEGVRRPHLGHGRAVVPNTAREHWIVSKNIERFEKLLENETDPEKRRIAEELLIAEKAKLGFKTED